MVHRAQYSSKVRQRRHHLEGASATNCVAWRLSGTKHQLSREFASRRFSFDSHVTRWSRRQALGTRGGGWRSHPPHGLRAPDSRHGHSLRTRIVSMVRFVPGALLSPLKMLGYIQPKGSHIHGAPRARAGTTGDVEPPREPSPPLCRNEVPQHHHSDSPSCGVSHGPTCSATNMVAVA